MGFESGNWNIKNASERHRPVEVHHYFAPSPWDKGHLLNYWSFHSILHQYCCPGEHYEAEVYSYLWVFCSLWITFMKPLHMISNIMRSWVDGNILEHKGQGKDVLECILFLCLSKSCNFANGFPQSSHTKGK